MSSPTNERKIINGKEDDDREDKRREGNDDSDSYASDHEESDMEVYMTSGRMVSEEDGSAEEDSDLLMEEEEEESECEEYQQFHRYLRQQHAVRPDNSDSVTSVDEAENDSDSDQCETEEAMCDSDQGETKEAMCDSDQGETEEAMCFRLLYANENPIQRLEILHCTGLLSDLTIQLSNKILQVHRFVLSMSSPVFRDSLLTFPAGRVLSKVEEVPDAFEWLIEYMYRGIAKFNNITLATQVFHLAEKYKMPSIHKICSRFLCATLRIALRNDEFAEVYNTAIVLRDEMLLDSCSEFVSEYTEDVLSCVGFVVFSRETIEHFLHQQLCLNAECKLFVALVRWCRAQLSFRGSDTSIELLRLEINPFLCHIRFLAMSLQEFSQVVGNTRLLTITEFQVLLKAIVGDKNARLDLLQFDLCLERQRRLPRVVCPTLCRNRDMAEAGPSHVHCMQQQQTTLINNSLVVSAVSPKADSDSPISSPSMKSEQLNPQHLVQKSVIQKRRHENDDEEPDSKRRNGFTFLNGDEEESRLKDSANEEGCSLKEGPPEESCVKTSLKDEVSSPVEGNHKSSLHSDGEVESVNCCSIVNGNH